MRRLAALFVTACSFRPGAGGSHNDALILDGPALCFGTGLGVMVCPQTPPSGDLLLSSDRAVVTDMGSADCALLVGPTANDYCAIVVTHAAISAKLSATGSRPLVVVSTSTIELSGTIDVASHQTNNVRGAGGDAAPCGDTDAAAAPGGGAGGTLGTQGGSGGNTGRGVPGPAIAATALRGGCPGKLGQHISTTGPPGHGGGAVDLIAVTSITIQGIVNASGAGGSGAQGVQNGGTGGGSGGMIVFDSPSVVFMGGTQLFANGGGGGGGSPTSGTQAGDGKDPTAPGNGGAHGARSGNAGDGGDGAKGTESGHDGGVGSTIADGGGGGGGGVGAIRVFQSLKPSGGAVSPPIP